MRRVRVNGQRWLGKRTVPHAAAGRLSVLELRARSQTGLLVGVALALLLLVPLLGPGVVLVRDMVFVPRTPLGGQLLGLHGVPRGVPSELMVALASRVVATGWLQDLVLVAIVVAGAWGAARLAPASSRVGAAAAATTYGWSPYLHERLLLGQWALLVGWAILPWAVRAALDWRNGGTGWWAVAALSLAALGGANALLLVAVAVIVCGRPLRALAATVVLSLPWLVPGLLTGVGPGDPYGVDAFAARSDSPLGLIGSLLTGGGVWAREAVPPARAPGSLLAVGVLVVAALGLSRLRAVRGNRLLVLAGVGLVLSLLGRMPGTATALRWAVVHVPAAGLLRDGQRWDALLVVVVSAAVACGADRLLSRMARLPVRRLAGVLVVLAPLAALPGGAWGESGQLSSSRFPADWERVTRQAHGDVLVLPWTLYRAFPWTDGRTVLDPATKLLERPVVDDDLPLPGRSVQGEDPLAARLDAAVTSGRPLLPVLQAAGVGRVLVERRTAGFDAAVVANQVAGLSLVTSTPELALWAVPAAGRAQPERVPLVPVLLGDLLAAGLGATAIVRGLRGGRKGMPEF